MNSTKGKIQYSVVVPIYNEEKNINPLNNEIHNVMLELGSYEIIYINDGSTDNSLDELKFLKNITIINLNRNYGQSAALDAGFKLAKGDIIISLDGDGQNDPRDIPRLVKKLNQENLDVVAGWRKKRQDKTSIKILTKIGMVLRRFLISDPVHDAGCTLRVYRAVAVKTLDLWGEMHRYILALLRWKGFKIAEMEVSHRQRVHGDSKYSYKKSIKGFVDLVYIWFINKYSNRPLHVFGTLGLISILLGILAEIYMLYLKIFKNVDLSNNAWFVLGFFLMSMGVQFFVSGIILDLVLRSYFNTSKHESRYYVKEILRR